MPTAHPANPPVDAGRVPLAPPAGTRVLVARIHSVLRRREAGRREPPAPATATPVRLSTVESHLLADDARQSELLRTGWGDGYVLVADVTTTPP